MDHSEGVIFLSVGVLALQGGFSEHISHLQRASKLISENNVISTPRNVRVVQVKTPKELDGVDGLIIPGGETTAISVFLQKNNFELLNALRGFGQSGKPIFGTCAGMILLANQVEGQMETGQFLIGGMDVEVCRNYYGSQTQSFEASLEVEENELLSTGAHRMIFIRAPGIKRMDVSKVKILAKYNDAPVALRQENLLATSFHPELTPDLTWHFYFLNMILQHKAHYKK